MSVTISSFLRNALYADAAFSSVGAILMAAGAPLLAPLLNLPQGLLVGAGLVLVPYVALLVAVGRRSHAPRIVIVDIIGLNALWVAASLGLLVSGLVAPNALGIAFVAAQALAVAILGTMQAFGLRRIAA